MARVLVTGAVGQIGSELTLALREKHGSDNVVAGGRKTQPSPELRDSGPFEVVDCTDVKAVEAAVKKYEIGTIYHLAALLSAVAEANPTTGLEREHQRLVQRSGGGPRAQMRGVRAQFDRRFWALDAARRHAAGHHPKTQHHVWGHQGGRRVAVRLLSQAVWRRYPRRALSGHHLQRDVARRGHYRLRGRDLLRGHQEGQVHLLPEAGHEARHDVHARRDQGRLGPDGRRPASSSSTATPST